jgi:hypothetical protein
MALEGNLNSFGLSEILQLISVQQKTGMLTVQSEHGNGVMFFRDGQVVSTRDRRRRARDPFKDYVTRYGVLGREALMRISQIASQSKLDFVDIIASEGLLTEADLEKHWRKQLQEAMHDVLTWEQCSYKFISSEEIVKDIKTLESYSVEAMLMESMRRIDEFPQMLEQFPSDMTLVTRVDPDPAGERPGTGRDAGAVAPAKVGTATPTPFPEAIEPGQVSLGDPTADAVDDAPHDPFALDLDESDAPAEPAPGDPPAALEAKTEALFDEESNDSDERDAESGMNLGESLGAAGESLAMDEDDGMTQNAKDILALIIGTVTIRDLIARGKMPTFEVYEALKLLVDKGRVSIREVEVAGPDRTAGPTRKRRRRRRAHRNPLPFVASLVLFAAATGVGLYRPAVSVLNGDALHVTVLQDDEMARIRLEHHLRWLLEAYRAENGAYPPNLDELVEAGLAGERLLETAKAEGFRYRLTAGRAAYTLL